MPRSKIEIPKEVVRRAIREGHGVVARIAQILGVAEPTVYRLIDEHGLLRELERQRERQGTRKYTKAEVKRAIEKAMGNIAAAAQILGVDRSTVYSYIRRYNLQEEVERAREAVADLAEAKMIEKIKEGNERLIEFALRAYRPEIFNQATKTEHAGEVVIRVVYEDEQQ